MNKIQSIPFVTSSTYYFAIEELLENNFNKKAKGVPPYDCYSDGDNVRYEIAVAGLSKEDIEITVEDNKFTVKSSPALRTNLQNIVHSGLNRRGFTFTQVDIRREYDLSKMIVHYLRGLLVINIPKSSDEPAKKLSIDIQ